MASIKSINFLPQVFRSDTNQKFLAATLDQLTSEPDFKKLSGYIGRRFSVGYKPSDTFVPEPDALRQAYQLEPAVSISDAKKNVTFFSSYPDLLQKLSYHGGLVNNHGRLFSNESYNFNSLVDVDKLVNFHQYLWMPNGPPEVEVSAFPETPVFDYRVIRDTTIPAFRLGKIQDGNPIITLTRGETYTFRINSPGNGFYIQSKRGLNLSTELLRLSREVLGVNGNGSDKDNITFEVPLKDAQNDYTEAPSAGSVDFAVDVPYKDLQKHLVSALEKTGGIDGVTGVLDGRTLIFAQHWDKAEDWLDPGIFDFDSFDSDIENGDSFSGGLNAAVVDRYNVWRIRVVENHAGDTIVKLEPYKKIDPGFKVTIKQGKKYAGVEFLKNIDSTQWDEVPLITAPLNELFYYDATDDSFAGRFILRDPSSNVIDVASEIIGKQNYTSPNGVRFTGGMVVRFDNTAFPASYKNSLYIVGGVGNAITLVAAGNYVVPEPYALLDQLATPDYIVVDRAGEDLNAWTRSNRWFHQDLIKLAAQYNQDPDILLLTEQYQRAQRPIIEFDPNIELYSHGVNAKAMVDILDFTVINAFKQVEGQEAFTFRLPNGKTKQVTAGMRIIFAGDQDPDVSSRIYLVQYIVTSLGSQIHLVSQNTTQINTYYVDNNVILENQLYGTIPEISYAQPYPAVGAVQATGRVVLNTTSVQSLTATYGGLNYLPGVSPSVAVDTQFTQPAKFGIKYSGFTYLENIHITNSGTGYTNSVVINLPSPNTIELTTAVAPSETSFSAVESQLVYVSSLPATDLTGAYIIGPGIPGGTTILATDTGALFDTAPVITISQPITIQSDIVLTIAQTATVVAESSNRSTIVMVDDSTVAAAGMIVSGGKTLMSIANITTGDGANPAQVRVSEAHNMVDSDLVYITQVESGPIGVNNTNFYIKVIDEVTFALYTDSALTAAYDATNSATYNTDEPSGTVASKFIAYGLTGVKIVRIVSATEIELDQEVTLEAGTVLNFIGIPATASVSALDGKIASVWVTHSGSGYDVRANVALNPFDGATGATITDIDRTSGFPVEFRSIPADPRIEYFNISNAGTGYIIGENISARIISSLTELTSAESKYESDELKFASSANIQYVKPGWQVWLVLSNGTYGDFALVPRLDADLTGPNRTTNQYFADTGNSAAIVYTVESVDLVNNIIKVDKPLDILDNDGNQITLPAGTKIFFSCKSRYFTEDGTFASASVGLSRAGYKVKTRNEYQYDAANLVSILELDSVLGLQVNMRISDLGNTYGDVRILSINSATNSVVIDRNLAIPVGAVLYATSATELAITLNPATIKEIILTEPGAEYTAAPVATVSPTKTPVQKIISSRGETGATAGEVVVNSLEGIEVGAVVVSEYQESGYGITTGGDVIRILSTRTVQEAGVGTTYRAQLGIARYFVIDVPLDLMSVIYLPNVIGLELGMTLDDDLGSFIPTSIVDIDSGLNKVTVASAISAPIGAKFRFYRPVEQPVFGDVFATFSISARVATLIASRNVTITDFNDTTPETYEVGDTILVATPTNILQTAKGVPEYNQYQAVAGKNGRVDWIPAQAKTKINQAPRFDVFDTAGVSLGNQTKYTGSKFAGTKIFSYADGTGTPDTVLGFRIKYKNFNNQGDILFNNNFYNDTFTYLNNGVETTELIRGFNLRRYDPITKVTKRVNQWQPIDADTEQYQVISYNFDNKSTYFQIDITPRIAKTIPTLRVHVNNKMLAESQYSLVTLGARLAILVDPTAMVVDAKVDIEILSDSISTLGHYQLPVNYELNPFNTTFEEITLGQMRSHLVQMTKNHYGLVGDVLHSNNLRDVNFSTWQGSLLQHASPVLFSHLFLNDKQADAVASIEYAAREYTRFKNRFLDMATKVELGFKQTSLTADVDKLITAVMNGKTPRSAWYNSDMVPWGKNKTVTRLPVIDAQERRYEIPDIFDDSILSDRAVLVYYEDPATATRRQLTKGIDFVFEKQIPVITLSDSFVTSYTSALVIEDYSTIGNFVPETPTKLGMYPKFLPRKYLDNSYQEPVNVIQGHDGSITPAFNDFRDNLLLELELRIYNNIKTDYETGIFNHYDLVPGKFRKTGYSRTEFTQILTKRFLKWIGANRVDYALNKWWNNYNAFTWNYSRFVDIIDGEALPGFWRGIYMYFFDTDRPHVTPWEMLGFSEKPKWWEDKYGPAPYTGGNLTMWNDLEKGYIAAGDRIGVDARFVRPGLLKVIPVDENGLLISPEKLFLASFDFDSTNGSFQVGDVGPTEAAWRKSSDYPFSLQIGMLLAFPGYYLGTMLDTSRYFYDPELKQYLHKEVNARITPNNVSVPDDGVISGNIVRTAGYLNWIKDYLVGRGIDGTSYIQNMLTGAEVTLAYRMAGFSDKRYINVIADQSSPGSKTVNIVIPDQNYRMVVNKSTPIQRAVYSAVIVERTNIGWTVSGYDLNTPFFTIIPSIATNNAYNIEVLNETATIFNDYQPIKITIPYGYEFTKVQEVVDFLNSYQRFMVSQGFDFEDFNSELGKKQDFILSAEEFLMWSQQGWAAGTILVLSPVFDTIKYTNASGVVDSVSDSLNSSKVLDQNFTLIKNNYYTVTRSGTDFSLRSLFAHTLGLVDLDIIQYEHIMLFDNTTVFNDVMYQPELGVRQTRLILNGYKTNNWTGQLDPAGLTYNSTKVESWRPNINYRRGSLIEYKDKVYVASQAIPSSSKFDFVYWQVSDINQISTGMLPNWATLADNGERMYDIDRHPADEQLDAYSHGLIGFRERDYLSDFKLDRTTQVKFYQGYIKRKGTMNAITALTSAKLSDIANDVKVYEDWAVRVGEYGTLGGDQYIELQLDESSFSQNPDMVVLNQRDAAAVKGAINVNPSQVYGYSELEYNPAVTKTRTADTKVLSDLVLAGYPHMEDINGTLFDITDIAKATPLVANMGAGYKLWVAKDFNSVWNVFRMSETGAVITSIDYALGGSMNVNIDVSFDFKVNDVVVIKNFNALLNGIYLVKSVLGSRSFSLALDETTVVANTLRRQQSISGTGILFKATSVRVKELNEIVNETPLYQWRDEDKVWVDNDTGTGKWGVYKKTDGWKFKQPLPLRDEDVREAEGYGTVVKLNKDNQLMLAGAPTHTEGSLRGIKVLSQGQDYSLPILVIDLPQRNNGQSSTITTIPLSNGAISTATVTVNGSGYTTLPSITIVDQDIVTAGYTFGSKEVFSTKAKKHWTGISANTNVVVGGTAGIKVGDRFNTAGLAIASYVTTIYPRDNKIKLSVDIGAITNTTANVTATFTRTDYTQLEIPTVTLTRTINSSVSSTTFIELDSVAGIRLNQVVTASPDFLYADKVRVKNVFTNNNTIQVNQVVSTLALTVTIYTQAAYPNDRITGTGIVGTVTVTSVTVGSVSPYGNLKVQLNAPVTNLTGNSTFIHGSGAILTPRLEPVGIGRVAIINAGSGYADAPNFIVEGGGGSGAVVEPIFSNVSLGTKTLVGVNVVDPGSGYTSEPYIKVEKNSPGVDPVLRVYLTPTGVNNIVVKSQGAGYQNPVITIDNPPVPAGNVTATGELTVTSRSIPRVLQLTNAGSGYTKVPDIRIQENDINSAGAGAVLEALMPTGIVRCFTRVNSNSEDILQVSSLKAPTPEIREFGAAIDVGYSIAAIGAPGSYQSQGAVCIAKAISGQWAITQIIGHPDTLGAPASARFGESLAMSRDENWLYISAPGQDRVYVYAKQMPSARAVIINYQTGNNIYFLEGLYNVLIPQELRVLGASGRVYEPGIDYAVSDGNIVFTQRAGVNDTRISVTKFFISSKFKPQFVRGAPVKIYELSSIPEDPASIFVLGSSGTAYVLHRDYEIINRKQLQWLTDSFASEESFAVDAIESYYKLIDIVDPPTGNTGSQFGAAISTNADGYQLAIGAPQFQDEVVTKAATTVTALNIVVKQVSTIKVGYTVVGPHISAGSDVKVTAVNTLTHTITLDAIVDVVAGDSLTFTSDTGVGRAYLYDRSYERVLQKSTKPVKSVKLRTIPRGPARVLIDRNTLIKDYDYFIEGRTVNFVNPLPYGSSIKFDINEFILVQEFNPFVAVRNGEYGKTVDVSQDNKNIAIGQPGYREEEYYNGAVYRYINQGLAYGKIIASRAPNIEAATGIIKFNDNDIAFGGASLDTGGYTTNLAVSAINGAKIVGLTATGKTEVFISSSLYEYVDATNHSLGYQLVGEADSANYFTLTSIVPHDNTNVLLITTTKSPIVATQTELIRGTDYTFVYTETTDTWRIHLTNPLLETLTYTQRLLIQTPITVEITRGGTQIEVMPGLALTPGVIGIDTYIHTQTFKHPSSNGTQLYGSKLKFDETGESLMIASKGGTTLKYTTFDTETTTVDKESTRLIDILKGSGAVYLYDYLQMDNASADMPALFLYNQIFSDSYIKFADNFGAAIDINNGWVLVGADGYDYTNIPAYNAGIVHVFRNPGKIKSWSRLRQYSDKVDIDYVNKLLLYDRKDQVTVAIPDYVDPAKGKILGTADQEIDYKTTYDPAYYNIATRATVTLDKTAPWSVPQVGQIWWNLDACRYIDYEQDNMTYRSRHWGELFPGSEIEICEWVESTVLPSAYQATYHDGIPKYADNSAYVTITGVDSDTGLVLTRYYFWVKNKNTASSKPTRKLSALTVKKFIEDPTNSNSPFIAVIAPNAFNFYGFRPYLKGTDTIFRYEYAKIRNNHIAHSEFELVAEGNSLSIIPQRVLNKLVDSISGENAVGQLVPDPLLINTSQTGIQIRPRQSMFKDQQTAALIFTQYINDYFKKRPVGSFNIDKLSNAELIPDSSFYQSTVLNYESLTYIDLNTVYDGYRILVQQDETVKGYWAVYFYRQSSQTWFLERIQSYDTTRYWKYIDWYATGYSYESVVDTYLNAYQDIQKIVLQAGKLIRVAKGTSGGWELYYIDESLKIVNVGIEKGTIEFSDLIYKNVQNQVGYDTGGFDTAGYGKTISIEIRSIVEALLYDVFSGVASDDLDLNDFFFAMVNYILTEQKQVDWLLKTSFMSVVHKRDQLQQIWNYQRDNQSYYENFIAEVKPYRSNVKQYLLDYTNLENAKMVVTDFDLPPIYDRSQSRYRVLDPNSNIDAALIASGEGAAWLSGFSYSIQNIVVVNGGSGYIDPLMSFTSPTGTGTVAIPNSTDGVITDILVEEGGTGYLDIPSVDIIGSTGSGFQGSAVMGVDYAIINNGGGGYEVGDIITYTQGTGTAVFQVAKVTGGVVDVVNTTSAGEFRTSDYQAVTTSTTGSGAGVTLDLVYKVVAVIVTVGGTEYTTSSPRVVISGGGRGSGAKARAIIVKGRVANVILSNSGSNYTSIPDITFVGGGGTGAKAYAQLSQGAGGVTSKTKNKTIRSITTKMKFDRIAYTTNVDRWKPLRTYHVGDIVVIPDNVTRTFINVPDQVLPQKDAIYSLSKTLLAAETFDTNLLSDSSFFTKLSGASLENVLERLGAFNRPGTPDAGRVFRSFDTQILEAGDINSKIVSVENNWNRASVALTVPPTHEYRYAMVGNRTTMAVSKDGITWTHADLRDQGVNLRGISFVNKTTWIAYGTNGSTFETTDGETWSRVLIDEYRYSPDVDNINGQLFSTAAATIDITDSTAFSSTFANYSLVVGSRGLILLNSYGSETEVGDRWVSARVPNELIDVQYLVATNRDFGYLSELDYLVYDGAPTSYDGNGDPATWNPSVAKTSSGYFYIPSQENISGLSIPRRGFKKGFVIVAGVNGYIYFASYQNLEDLHNGYYTGYNYNNGKNITGNNNDIVPVSANYPWVQTLVPRAVSGLGDGASGEHIADIAIGSEPDIWTVAVGSGGTLLWNVIDIFTQVKSGSLAGVDAVGKTLISHSVDPFVEWRIFDEDQFEYPLTRSSLATENFTSVDYDGEKFVVVSESNRIYWGYPGSKSEAFIDIAPRTQDTEMQTLSPDASWDTGTNVTSIIITVPTTSMSGIPSVGQLLTPPTTQWPLTIVTAVSTNTSGTTQYFTLAKIDGTTFTVPGATSQRLVFYYGTTKDFAVGETITFTGPIIKGSTLRESVTLTLSRPAPIGTSEFWFSDYHDVAANWVVPDSQAGIPLGCFVTAIGKFAKFNWKIATGSKKSNTRSFSSVITNTTTIELSQPLVGDLPIGTEVNFFDPTGSRFTLALTQKARAKSSLLTVETNIEILAGFTVATIQTGRNLDGTALYALPGNTTVKSSRQYILTGGVSRLEKDIADKVPGIAYSGVRVTGTPFTEDVTKNILEWAPNTAYKRGDRMKFAGQIYTATKDVVAIPLLTDLSSWEFTTVLPTADDLDTEISSSFTDNLLGQRPEDIVVDGGKFIDRFNSHAPEELVPGAITDLLQMSVFTKDPAGSDLVVGFKIFADQKSPAEYYRVSNYATTTLVSDLNYLSTQISLTDVAGLPDPNPADNRPGSVFINGEKIIYLGIDREENKLLNIRRGASRTSIPLLHKAGSLVSDASVQQQFDTDFATKILEDATYDNFLGDTSTYHIADVSSIQQARTFLDLGNKE